MRFEEIRLSVLNSGNPYLVFGLAEASKKLPEHYPIRSSDIEPIKNLCLATVLDPRHKLSFFESLGLPRSAIGDIKAYFYRVYRHYANNSEGDLTIYVPEVIESPLSRSPCEWSQDKDESEPEDKHEIEACLKEKRIRWFPNIMMYHNDHRKI